MPRLKNNSKKNSKGRETITELFFNRSTEKLTPFIAAFETMYLSRYIYFIVAKVGCSGKLFNSNFKTGY